MSSADNAERDVLVPSSLGDALNLLRHERRLAVWAGGTSWMYGGPSGSPADILSLHEVRELRRVVRSGTQLEIGATVPIGRLISVGDRYLPEPAIQALRTAGPPPVRSIATIGGAISMPGLILPITACLQLLDGWAELRRQGKSRWAPLGQLRDRNGSMRINETELVTRIKIPPREWTHWMLRTFGSPFPPGLPSLTLAGAAIMDKTGIHEFRFSVVIDGRAQIRLREAETDLAGRAVPLTERDRRAVMSALEDHEFYGSRLDDLGRWRAGNGLREFLLSLG